MASWPPVTLAVQRSFDDLGTALIDQEFVVLDLETTGGAATASSITEIGAVRVRGGDVVAEFQTLINPLQPIPPTITMLTGITDEMVAGAPLIEDALPAFFAWLGDAVIVAHNASFDLGFLRTIGERIGVPAPRNPVVCTVRLAKRLVADEVRNLKLATLAHAFGARTRPSHRALADARATVDVFHGLLERVGSWGIGHTEELLWFQSVRGHPAYHKAHLFERLPSARGVYRFVDAAGRVLYVGKATDLRTRVRGYFGDQRRRIGDLLRAFDRVEHTVCATDLDASVLEARWIRSCAPDFNRAQRGQAARWWLALTDERFPRLTRIRQPRDGAIGPLSARQAEAVKEAIEEGTGLRSCTDRIASKPSRSASCVRGQTRTCTAPCVDPAAISAYRPSAEAARATLTADPSGILDALDERIRRLGERTLFEQAASTRDRASTLVRTLIAARRLRALVDAGDLTLAIGGTRLRIVDGFLASVDGVPLELPADGHPDEPRLIAAWLARNTHRVRVESSSGPFATMRPGGAALTRWEDRLRANRS